MFNKAQLTKRALIVTLIVLLVAILGGVETPSAQAAGFAIKTTPKFPVFYLFYALLPYFRATGHRLSSVIPLMQHFDRNGYFSASGDMQRDFPDFSMTSLPDHLRRLFEAPGLSK